MAHRRKKIAAAIGFRVKTGRAIAVLLVGPIEAPRVLDRRTVELCAATVPWSRQPYHAALELPEKEVRRLSSGRRSLRKFWPRRRYAN